MQERRSGAGEAVRRREAIQLLKRAMAEERLSLRYQPIIDLGAGRPFAVEALLRWRDPAMVEHPLSDVIAAAERSPVIFDLETWIARTAGSAAASWLRGPLPELRLHLNLSAREFVGPAAPDQLARMVQDTGIDVRRLTLEVTETAAIRDPHEVAPTLERLREQGPELWLDDFGTGHSSVAWLRYFPIDGIKLPELFVREVVDDPKCSTIVPALIDLGHKLGLRVIAEGVEEERQLSFLRAHGCDAAQGLLFHPPMTAEQVVSTLTADQEAAPSSPIGRPSRAER